MLEVTPRRFDPVVIGATGGSGTRALRKVLEIGGIFMGDNVNVTGDAMAFEGLYDRHINTVIQLTGGLNYAAADLPAQLAQRICDEIAAAAQTHCQGQWPEGLQWGWKTPRAMYLLPLIAEVFPQFRFIHVLRDGRDMVTAGNQLQRDKHAAVLFADAALEAADPRLTAARLWAKANDDVASWARQHLGDRYLPLIFEDLCAAPAVVLAPLFAHLNLSADRLEAAVRVIQRPQTIGRWAELDGRLRAEIDAVIAPSRRRFGYEQPS